MAARRALILAALGGALGGAGCGGAAERPIDVLLVSLDSVRADDLTFDDPERAPNLARLAGRGVVFTECVSGSSWTLPAHAQMFTGQPPLVHGVELDDVRIDPLTPTLPELLRATGRYTAGFFTGWYLTADYGFGRGFDVYENCITDGAARERAFRRALDSGDAGALQRLNLEREIAGHRDVTSTTLVERAIAHARNLPDDRALFLFAHLFDPHYDYVPPAPWDTAFDPDYAGDLDGRDFFVNPRIYDAASHRRVVSDRDLQHVRALYRGEIGWTDQELGRLLDALEESGRLEHTLVIVTADHGDEFFEHGGRGHRHTLFDELVRVPLLVVPPGGRASAAPARVDAPVELSDLLPTILDYCAVETPETSLGRSLRPAVEGASPPASDGSVASLTLAVNLPDRRLYQLTQTHRVGDEKLVRVLELDDAGALTSRAQVLFDLSADPRERHPIPDGPALEAASARFDAALDELRDLHARLPRSTRTERSTSIRQLFASELGALGYGEESSEAPGGLPWGPGPPPALGRDD